jgi:hypothetical protein
MSYDCPGPVRQLVGSLTVSIGTEYVGVMVGVGVRVIDNVGEGSGVFGVFGVFVNVGVPIAFNVIATRVAAWSFKSFSSSEPVSGMLQAVSSRHKNKIENFRMGTALFFWYL